MTRPPDGRRSARRFGLRVLGSAAILGGLLLVLPFGELVAALRRVPAWAWAAAQAAYLLLHVIGIVKWRLLINAAGAGLSFAQAARCYYYGLFGNTFLPSIVGGDIVRAGLALSLSRSRSGLLLGSVVDRTLDILGLAAVAGIGALLLPTALDAGNRIVFFGLAAVFATGGAIAGAVLLVLPARRCPMRVRRRLVRAREAVRALRTRPGTVGVALLLGMLLQSLLVVLNAWLGDIVGIRISLVVWLFVWPLAKISAVVPITQGGIGVREAAIVALFQPFGVPAVAAMATGLIFEAVVIVGGLLGGLIAAMLARVEAPPSGARS